MNNNIITYLYRIETNKVKTYIRTIEKNTINESTICHERIFKGLYDLATEEYRNRKDFGQEWLMSLPEEYYNNWREILDLFDTIHIEKTLQNIYPLDVGEISKMNNVSITLLKIELDEIGNINEYDLEDDIYAK